MEDPERPAGEPLKPMAAAGKESLTILREPEFGALVRGNGLVIELPDGYQVHLRLKDVPFERMYFHIERAMRDKQAEEGKL